MTRWHYIAQRATTGEFLHYDVPLQRDELSWVLSGAGSLRGTVTPDVGNLRTEDGRLLLEEWGTLLYAEADGEIRWGGIVVSSEFDGAEWRIEAAGFATYPHGIPYSASYSRIGVDPADVIRHLWEHVQGYPDGDLGVVVTGATATGTRLGTPETVDEDGEPVDAEPYELLWWEAPDVGEEIDSLTQEAGLDYVERHRWDGEEIRHDLELYYPRAGRRRDDLAFVQGDNVVSVVAPVLDGEDFANEVLGIGAGEGSESLRRTTARRDGRLRRVYTHTAKDVASRSRLAREIGRELDRRRQTLRIESIEVRDHVNAPIGSWALGDDVRVQAEIPWLGEVDLWCRVVGWALLSDHTARLDLVRSDSFIYGG